MIIVKFLQFQHEEVSRQKSNTIKNESKNKKSEDQKSLSQHPEAKLEKDEEIKADSKSKSHS